MILVDSSVLIAFLRGTATREVATLDDLLDRELVAVGDIMLCEVLQGLPTDRQARDVEAWLRRFDIVTIVDDIVAVEAARQFRTLRGLGVTIRKTIDLLIAARCMRDGLTLLHADRDFAAIAAHLPLAQVR